MRPYQPIKDTAKEHNIVKARLIVACLCVLLLVLVILGRFFTLQILDFQDYQTKSQENRVHLQRIAPKRGLVWDSEQRLVAENQPSYFLAIVRDRVEDIDLVFEELLRLEIISEDDIATYEKKKNRYRAFEPAPLKFRLSDEDIAKVAANRVRLPGVEVVANLVRYYPQKELLAHMMGYVGRINEKELAALDADNYGATTHIGKIGIEKSYEQVLHGKVGYEYVETNARGVVLRTLEREDPVPGSNLELFLDLDLQRVALEAMGDHRGAVVAIDPKTGGILAAVSTPTFDSNLFVNGISFDAYNALRDDIDLPLFNRIIQAQYPPGSTIKPIMSLAGLEEKVFTTKTTVEDPGWYQLPNDTRLYRDWKRQGHAERVGFIAALEQSCDVYYYDLAYKLGVDNIHRYYDFFGLGLRTGIDVPNEWKGLNPSNAWKKSTGRSSWYPGDTLNIGIGQGYLLATPMQLAYATTIIANKGERIVPRLVAKIDGQPVPMEKHEPLVLNKPQHWEDVIDGMLAVVHGKKGTAQHIGRGLDFQIAGKTGTAQVVGIAQGEKYDASQLEERKRDHALFVAFAPADDPQIVVAVVVENGESGSSTAAPIARAVIVERMRKLKAREQVQEGEPGV